MNTTPAILNYTDKGAAMIWDTSNTQAVHSSNLGNLLHIKAKFFDQPVH